MIALCAVFGSDIRGNSPNGAGFDSPGRQPWGNEINETKAPTGRDSRRGKIVRQIGNRAPLGLPQFRWMRQPRADAPWAAESRPLGADARLRRRRPIGTILAHLFTTDSRR